MSHSARISGIKEAPISWKERDLLTAAEQYMKGIIDFSLVEFSLSCFPKIDQNTSQKIDQVWACIVTAYHLQMNNKKADKDCSKTLPFKAARIYEQEAQRLLGSMFSIDHKFWKAFYTRQELEATKPLVTIDALHFSSNCQAQIAYQLLLQSLKAILVGHYEAAITKKEHFENAKRLLSDLPVPQLISWLNQELI